MHYIIEFVRQTPTRFKFRLLAPTYKESTLKQFGNTGNEISQINSLLVSLHLGTTRPDNCWEWCSGSDSFHRWEHIKSVIEQTQTQHIFHYVEYSW